MADKPIKRNDMSDMVHRIKMHHSAGLKEMVSKPGSKVERKEPPRGR